MNDVLLYPLVLLAIYIFAVSVILTISTVRKSGKHKYRIKKVTVGTKDEYYIQKHHFLFFWYTCQELQWAGGYEEVCFDTLLEAKKYIDEKRKEKIDKKIEYIYY